MTNGKLIGKFMSYYDAADVFTEAEVDLAVAIARQLGFGVERIRAEEALRESEARESARAAELRTIMEAVPAVIWIARDLECRVISGNQASHDFLRLSRETNPSLSATEDERPRNFEVLVGGRVLAPEELPVQRAARGEEIRNFEHETRFNDGTSRYLFGNATPLRDAEGNPCGAARVCGYYRSQESGRTAPVAHRGTEPSREEHAGHRHLDSAAIVLQKSKRR